MEPQNSIKTGKARPPYVLSYKIPNGTEVCSKCGLPGGRIRFTDSEGRPFVVTTNTNFIVRPDKSVVHQNNEVCALASKFKSKGS